LKWCTALENNPGSAPVKNGIIFPKATASQLNYNSFVDVQEAGKKKCTA